MSNIIGIGILIVGFMIWNSDNVNEIFQAKQGENGKYEFGLDVSKLNNTIENQFKIAQDKAEKGYEKIQNQVENEMKKFDKNKNSNKIEEAKRKMKEYETKIATNKKQEQKIMEKIDHTNEKVIVNKEEQANYEDELLKEVMEN
ncbi:hypothetical protein HOG47_08535 [archaeon]|jgi:hypothetical protein|nr:hypothetical protein [archaeon]